MTPHEHEPASPEPRPTPAASAPRSNSTARQKDRRRLLRAGGLAVPLILTLHARRAHAGGNINYYETLEL
jgi:hypothetical protein